MKPTTRFITISFLVNLLILPTAHAQSWQEQVISYVDDKATIHEEVANDIWHWAELGFEETNSSLRLQNHLRENEFKISSGVAGMPTAFVATYGEEGPVIGFIAEFDALPGLSQALSPIRSTIDGQVAGHACGHHLLGTAAAESAIAVKEWLEATGTKAILRIYGSPAEEGGGGKVYLTREGLLDDVDALMNWHPADRNFVNTGTNLATYSGKFRFKGISAHAAAAPERGRSALDGVEAMNHMVNMMHEHLPEKARVHYVITSGGKAPNVVPNFSEVYYIARHPDPIVASEIWQRISNAAEGAALGTDTTVSSEIIGATYPTMTNDVLAKISHDNLSLIGGVSYTMQEKQFAEQISLTFGDKRRPHEEAEKISDLVLSSDYIRAASSDVGDMSWVTPTTFISTATWVPGTNGHSWQAVAAGNTTIGYKGMHVASKTMALTAIDLIQNPELIEEARAELERRRGADFKYKAMVGDRLPPLDYGK